MVSKATENTASGTSQDEDPFSDPGSASGYPSLKQLKGRVVIVVPKVLEKGLPNTLNPGQTRDRLTADVHVLTGDDITARVDDDDNETPFDEPMTVPFKLTDMYLSGAMVINEVRAKLPQGEEPAGMVIGVLTKLPPLKAGQKGAWSLAAATDEQKQIGRKYLANIDPFA
jgi:hypothetical protein